MAKSNSMDFTVDIVAAFISNNSVPIAEVPNLIDAVHGALSATVKSGQARSALAGAPIPAVSIRKSVTPDYLICLENGKRYKTLRQCLTRLGMTPAQYRAKWELPLDYPMVASNFAAKRSELAKHSGFWQARGKRVAAPAQVAPVQVAPECKGRRPRS